MFLGRALVTGVGLNSAQGRMLGSLTERLRAGAPMGWGVLALILCALTPVLGDAVQSPSRAARSQLMKLASSMNAIGWDGT